MKKQNQKKSPDQPTAFNSMEVKVSEGVQPLENVLSRSAPGPILEMQTGLFALGLNRAQQSGTTEPRPDDIRSLEAHARAMARDTYRDKFDPKHNFHDRMMESEYQKLLIDRKAAEDTEQHASANVRDAEDKLARTPKAGVKPTVHPLLVTAAILVLAVTVAPTLHDFVFYGLDDLLAWFLAFVSSAFVGALITCAILNGRRTAWQWLGMAAGIAMGLGLGLLRLSSASETSEVLYAMSFTIVEIAVVVLLEWFALGLRNSEDLWNVCHTAESEAIAHLENAQAELSRCQTRIKNQNNAISEKILYVEDRHNRNLNVTELESLAVKAVLDGYNAGISENIGRVRGVSRRTG